MEPENSRVKEAAKALERKEQEIDGSPRRISVPKENTPPQDIQMPKVDSAPSQGLDQTPVSQAMAPGYNPNMPQASEPGSSTLKNPGLAESQVPKAPIEQPTTPTASQPVPNPHEGAPDIGKDYGDSLGTPPAQVQRENPNIAERGAATPESQPQSGGRPNELEKAKQEQEQEKAATEAQKAQDGKKGPSENSNEQNPEAPDSSKRPKSEKEIVDEAQSGNGYGALKKPQTKAPTDSTELARRNMAHNNRVQQGVQAENGTKPKVGTKSSNNPKEDSGGGLSAIGSRIKSALTKGLTKRGSKNEIGKGDGKGGKKVSNAFKGAIKKKILTFLATHPYALLVIVFLIILLLVIFASSFEDSSGSGKKGTHCTYNLNGVTLSGSVELSNLQVELINCDGTASNYSVLETVDFEKYVLGVALAEIGESSPDEAIKAQIIAARNFALTRNSGMCPGNPDECFYGYNTSTGKIRMRACEADQVYWDYNKDIYRENRGSISLYTPEVTSGSVWKHALSDQRKQEVQALAAEVKGEVLVDSSDTVVHTSYNATTSEQFLSLAQQGKKYDEILKTVYDTGSSLNKAECTSYGNIDYGDYILSSDGNQILHEPLNSFLASNGTSLEEFNALIANNVENAGYGTRAGVVAAAVTLIAELGNNYGVKVPYYWGGGHYDGVVDGALGYWGSTQCHTYANNQSYNYCGLDCSGFVPWAIKNGGFNMVQNLAGNFQNLPGAKRVSLSSSPVLEPGDLLESSGHIVLVVGIDETAGVYICAEASGNQDGVLFTRRSFTSSGYWGVQMDGYYDTHARSN